RGCNCAHPDVRFRVAKSRLKAQIGSTKTTAAWRAVMSEIKYVYKIIHSPVGKLKLVATDKGLTAILWEKDDPRRVPLGPMKADPDNKFLKQTETQLNAYFD